MAPSTDRPIGPFLDDAQRTALAQCLATGMTDEDFLCDGFRAPDEAIVRTRVPRDSAAFPVGEVMDLGSSVSSDFWLVPRTELEQALRSIDEAVQAALPTGLNPTDDDASLVGVWHHPGAAVVLVGCISFGDWAADLSYEAEDYDWSSAIQLAYSGNDNGPDDLLAEVEKDSLSGEALDVLYGAIVRSEARDVLAIWKNEYADHLGDWSPPRRQAPKR